MPPEPTHPLPAGETGPAEFKRGPGGRPTQQEAARRHAALLDTAIRLFLEHGLDAVTIDQIAKEAAVAKRFIYARYRDKSALFVAAFEHWAKDRLDELQTFSPTAEPAETGLVKFGRKILDIALHPDAIAVQRLLITAAPRFPDLVQGLITRNRALVVERVLGFYAARGDIELADARMATEQFFMLVVGIPQRLALIGVREPAAQERRRLRSGVRLFLDGYRVRSPKA
jgi:TetR/AcrR family transcriptional regulator, mexJK operon transcriptional repressor